VIFDSLPCCKMLSPQSNTVSKRQTDDNVQQI
jgi:predicted phage tail protein